MEVLSLFDGISCGQLALERAGISYNNYYASEIYNRAIRVTRSRYPNTVQLGNVEELHNYRFLNPDLLLAGSPCQGFSRGGDKYYFSDSRSFLFYKFVEALERLQPRYFLLENVIMPKWCQNHISNILGVEPIMIDSKFFSAQKRQRLYWTNIPNVVVPTFDNNGIVLSDIIDYQTPFKLQGLYKDEAPPPKPCILHINYGKSKNSTGYRALDGKTNTITRSAWEYNNFLVFPDSRYRKLTPIEFERLQTIPDNYTAAVANKWRYKLLGDAWTVDVIAHILRNIK